MTAVDEKWIRVWKSRPDLQKAFPEVATGDLSRYVGWTKSHGLGEYDHPSKFPKELLAVATPPPSTNAPPSPTVVWVTTATAAAPTPPPPAPAAPPPPPPAPPPPPKKVIPTTLPPRWQNLPLEDMLQLAIEREVKVPKNPSRGQVMIALTTWKRELPPE